MKIELLKKHPDLVTYVDRMVGDKPLKYKCYSFIFFHHRVVQLISNIRRTLSKEDYSIKSLTASIKTCETYMAMIDEVYFLLLKYNDQLTKRVSEGLTEWHNHIKENYSIVRDIVQAAKDNYKRS